MANVHLFNPENDVALGYWKNCFTLSPLVRSLHGDGASLPMWYASAGDFVFDPQASATPEWYGEAARRFGLDVTVEGCVPSGLKGVPWGCVPSASGNRRRGSGPGEDGASQTVEPSPADC